jgi:NitT/TauT family transport system permease protein
VQPAGAVPPAAQLRRPGLRERHAAALRALVGLAVGLLLWEFVGRFIVTDPLFFVPFSSVIAALLKAAESGVLANDIWVSFVEFLLAFVLASVAGVALGIALGASRRLYGYIDPWVSALYATPLVALTPFFILSFGIGLTSKIAIAFTLAIFPALINSATGIRAVDPHYIEVARAFKLSRRQIFTKTLVPAALPYIVSGLRLAAGRALIGVVVGELFFSSAGVGYMISLASQTFDTASLLAGVLVFAAGGVLTTTLLRRLEIRLSPWREQL